MYRPIQMFWGTERGIEWPLKLFYNILSCAKQGNIIDEYNCINVTCNPIMVLLNKDFFIHIIHSSSSFPKKSWKSRSSSPSPSPLSSLSTSSSESVPNKSTNDGGRTGQHDQTGSSNPSTVSVHPCPSLYGSGFSTMGAVLSYRALHGGWLVECVAVELSDRVGGGPGPLSIWRLAFCPHRPSSEAALHGLGQLMTREPAHTSDRWTPPTAALSWGLRSS